MKQRTVIVIGGPTASGKSGLAIDIARQISGEIINADSMQLYNGLPMLTAQPSAADKALIPHHLYSALEPDEMGSAARWRDMALETIEKLCAEDKTPVVVGGTGFYLKTLIHGISPIPDVPHSLREKISAQQKEMGNPAFHDALKKQDPVMASRLHPFNTQRLIRAWEVLEHTGKSLSEWQKIPPVKPPAYLRFVVVTVLPPREELYNRCNARFLHMMEHGALDEAQDFMQRIDKGDIPVNTPLIKALGYTQLSAFLKNDMSREDAIAKAQQTTRHYAKRQTTWFRHQITADLIQETPDSAAVLTLIKDL